MALAKMRSDIQDFIIHQQQYFGRDYANAIKHPLWLLHELNNTDKHRALNATTVGTGSFSQTFYERDEVGITGSLRHLSGSVSFHDGDELAAFNMSIDEAISKGIKIMAQISSFVAFRERGLADVPIEHFLRGLIADVTSKVLKPVVALKP